MISQLQVKTVCLEGSHDLVSTTYLITDSEQC